MKKHIYLLGVGGILLLFSILFIPYQQVLSISYQDNDEMLAYLPITKSKTFKIQYTHSIHLSDVIETYSVKEKTIILKELSYEDFAVGMPANAEGDEVFEVKDGTYFITNMNRVFPFFDLRVGQVRANHRILQDTNSYKLKDFIKPGEWVRLSIQKLSFWQQLKGVKISGN
ncbi:DUF1850 domain-containing protein [Metabacillus litoralis]|uniref:DUF1850 domain-containing protein n=1 Tax=Metabacillus litoralis TaxID=152268 RepID=UPI001CFD3F54|nr:DUF1850 domain-containing protein [Metabacillus litoralis]